jgi:predicted GNAT family acetyltransferase
MTMIDNTAKQRYELAVGEHIVFADYRKADGVTDILYVEAPVALRGSGAAGQLMEEIAQQAKADGTKLHPICGYAVSWLKRHSEYEGLVI